MSRLILFDRSRSTTDWTCPRKRYINYELDGHGIVPSRMALELQTGILLHDSLAAVAQQHVASGNVDIDAIAHKAAAELYAYLTFDVKLEEDKLYAREQAALIEGMLRGFYKHCWPRLNSQYPKILAIEQEMSYEYEGLLFMCKPDLVAVDTNGEIAYIEYKSTSSKKDEWTAQWDTAVQLHATTRAIEASLGEAIGHIVVQGLYKGYESYGKQSSPFCYAYKIGSQPPFAKEQISYEYKAGFRKTPAWELPGSIKTWVDRMPELVLANQFPCTPPIFVNNDMVDDFFAQRNYREHEIDMALGMFNGVDDPEAKRAILNASFPQRFDMCTPGWGRPCEYKRICHGEVDKPLSQGFIQRTPHHAIELEVKDVQE